MVNRREAMLNSELIAKVSKPNVIELASVADDEHKQNLEPDNDILLNKFFHLGFDDRSHWFSFHPLADVVHGHDEKSLLYCYSGEWTKNVDPPLCEGPWCSDRHQWD